MRIFPSSGLFRTPLVDKLNVMSGDWQRFLSQWFGQTKVAAHTMPIPKLTGGGANGSLTWNENGIITGYVDPT